MARIQLRMKRYRQAINTWRRMIVFLTDENNELKLRLAETLKDTSALPGLIEKAEQYLGSFTQQDEVIYLARGDIAALELLVTREAFEQETVFKKMDKKYNQLHKEMEKLEREFNTLKFTFNTFLTGMP
jgi:chromosome segregation ATPase